MNHPHRPDDDHSPVIATRTAVLVLIGLMCAITAASLTWLAGRHPAEAILAGLLAWGGGYKFFGSLIG